jgi:hypothetical protein
MNRFLKNTVLAAFLAAAPLAAQAAQPAAVPVVTQPVSHHSTVHDRNGERFDVPNRLLRSPDTLINGLPPESMQFE